MTVDRFAARRWDAPAVTTVGGGTLSFGELDRQSARLANHLRANGLRPGDRVALLMDNSAEYAVAAWAARRSGLRAVPVNWQLTRAEVSYILADSGARALIAGSRFADVAVAAAAEHAVPMRLSADRAFAGFVPLADAIAGASEIEPGDQPDGAPMYYSSGTTGRPKGIVRDTGLRFGEQRPIEALYSKLYGIREGSVLLVPAPLYFAAPFGWMVAATALGAHVVLLPRFDAEATLAAIETYRCTHALFVPTHFVRLLQLGEDVRRRYDLSSLQAAVHAGAPCPPDVKAAMIAWWGPIIHEYYSGSEGAGFTAISSQEWLARPGSVGRAVTGAIHILDEAGEELPPGHVGTIWFEDAPRFVYHNAPEKTERFFNVRGWGSLGDLGHIDAEGYLYIADRRSDLILSGGANVYPQEIENAVAGHPAVLDVAAVGVVDAEFGQRVRLLVVSAPDQVGGAELEAELLAYCRARLAGYKCPRSLRFVPSLPRLASGKLLRRNIPEAWREP